MLIPPQLIRQQVNRELTGEPSAIRSQFIRVFNQLHRDAMAKLNTNRLPPLPVAIELSVQLDSFKGTYESATPSDKCMRITRLTKHEVSFTS